MSDMVRRPAVAGEFYPADPLELRATVQGYLAAARPSGPPPKAIIVPHAGYIYSGSVAASAYALLAEARQRVRRVVLAGPAHWVAVEGLAASGAHGFQTPLGTVPLDRGAITTILALPQVAVSEGAHAPEHSLEVQLPFLQETLRDFTLVPLAAGQATPQEVGQVLETLWGGPETLVVISSDLSHYHDYQTARQLDSATSKAIETLRFEDLRAEHACGFIPVRGLLYVARKYGLRARTLDLRNSGDAGGPRDRVVGYGAYAFEQDESRSVYMPPSAP